MNTFSLLLLFCFYHLQIASFRFNNINGFFGTIGGKKLNKISLSGDGIIQGVFIEKGKPKQVVCHTIMTDRQVFIKKYSSYYFLLQSNFFNILLFIGKHLKLIDNNINYEGRANTGLIFLKNHDLLLALYERDRPYSLYIDYKNNCIYDYCKILTHNPTFSAHPHLLSHNKIESLDYNVFGNHKGSWLHTYDDVLNLEKKQFIKTKYNSIVHDSISTHDYVYLPDCPLVFDMWKIIMSDTHIPMTFKKLPTSIIRFNKHTEKIDRYMFNESFFCFHFVGVKESETEILLDVCMFEKIDMDHLNKHLPKLYRLVINKETHEGSVFQPSQLQFLHLDFPIKFIHNNEMKYALNCLRVEDNNVIMYGFVVLDTHLNILNFFEFPNKNDTFVGEIAYDNKSGCLIGLCIKDNRNVLFFYDINECKPEYQKLEHPHGGELFSGGFHSIFHSSHF